MSAARQDLRDRLAVIADELGDLALERLRAAVAGAGGGDGEDAPGPDPGAVAEERRITRARRAVEKAVNLLDDGPADD